MSVSLEKKIEELERRLSKVEQALFPARPGGEIEGLRVLTKDDPIFQMIGIGESGLGDVSQNKHKYLLQLKRQKRINRR